MLSVLSRIWTRVAVSISYDDNHYTTGTSSLQLYGIEYSYRIQTIFEQICLTHKGNLYEFYDSYSEGIW